MKNEMVKFSLAYIFNLLCFLKNCIGNKKTLVRLFLIPNFNNIFSSINIFPPKPFTATFPRPFHQTNSSLPRIKSG